MHSRFHLKMSNSLSPSGSSSNLVIDDDLDIDNKSVTDEDLNAAEAKCGLMPTAGKVLARPGNKVVAKSIFKFGHPEGTSTCPIVDRPKMSSGDPRIRFKPTSLPSTSLSDCQNEKEVDNNNVTSIKRTVQNKFGSSSFGGEKHAAVSKGFKFGLTSPSIKTTQASAPTKYSFGSARFSPTQEDLNSSEDEMSSKNDVEMNNFIKMKETQEAKMKMEREKMLRIEKMIELKKKQKKEKEIVQRHQDGLTMDTEGNRLAVKEIELAKQAKELQNQTAMVMQMQQNMLMQNNNADQEVKRLEDQKRILELQLSVKNLERLIGQKHGLAVDQGPGLSSRPVWERVGSRSGGALGGVMGRVGEKRCVHDFSNELEGAENQSLDDLMIARKKRFKDGRSDQFDNNNGFKGNKEKKWSKKAKYQCASKLPDDLVLTEITDEGPVRKDDLREESRIKRMEAKKEFEMDEDDDLDRYEFEGGLDPDLVLTEFSEDGPVRAGSVDITSTSGK